MTEQKGEKQGLLDVTPEHREQVLQHTEYNQSAVKEDWREKKAGAITNYKLADL